MDKKVGWLIILLVLHLFTVKLYAQKKLIDLNECNTALLEDKKELYAYFHAVEREDTETLLTFKNIDLDTDTKNKLGKTLLFYAAQEGKVESIKVLVSKVGVNVNSRDKDSRTALHYAAPNPDILSRTNTIYALVQLDADIQAVDYSGNRPSTYIKGVKYTTTLSKEQEYKAIYLAIETDDILEISELLQISHNVLPHLIHDFRRANNLPVY